jgi:hypothetical protein
MFVFKGSLGIAINRELNIDFSSVYKKTNLNESNTALNNYYHKNVTSTSKVCMIDIFNVVQSSKLKPIKMG